MSEGAGDLPGSLIETAIRITEDGMNGDQRAAFEKAIGDTEGAWYAVAGVETLLRSSKTLSNDDKAMIRAIRGRLERDTSLLMKIRDRAELGQAAR